MKKIIKKINNIGNKVTDWLFVKSNHGEHFVGGAFCSSIPLIPAAIMHFDPFTASLSASISTIIAMAGNEAKDYRNGGKFDWQDIAAGSIWPVFQTLAVGLFA